MNADFSGYLEKPTLTFADVINDAAKRELNAIAASLNGNIPYEKHRIKPPRRVLMWGPPGTGKTRLARALAGETSLPFFQVPATSFFSPWIGESERLLTRCWEHAAAQVNGCVLFIDQFEVFCTGRGLPGSLYDRNPRLVGCLSHLMSLYRYKAPRLVVLAATNRIDDIDRGVLHDCFDCVLHVPVPTEAEQECSCSVS